MPLDSSVEQAKIAHATPHKVNSRGKRKQFRALQPATRFSGRAESVQSRTGTENSPYGCAIYKDLYVTVRKTNHLAPTPSRIPLGSVTDNSCMWYDEVSEHGESYQCTSYRDSKYSREGFRAGHCHCVYSFDLARQYSKHKGDWGKGHNVLY